MCFLEQHLPPAEVKQFVLWEGINADNFITKENQKRQENIDEKLKVTGDRLVHHFGEFKAVANINLPCYENVADETMT